MAYTLVLPCQAHTQPFWRYKLVKKAFLSINRKLTFTGCLEFLSLTWVSPSCVLANTPCVSNHTGQTCLTTHVCCSRAHPLLLICPISLLQGKTQACFFWSCDPVIVICSRQSDKHRFPESKSGARKLQAKYQHVLKLLQKSKLLKKKLKEIWVFLTSSWKTQIMYFSYPSMIPLH